jgi:hypothetical protein
VLDRLQEEPAGTTGVGTDELDERGDRRLQIGKHLAPDRDDRMVTRE